VQDLEFLTYSYKLTEPKEVTRAPMTQSALSGSGSINMPEWLTDVRETLRFTGLL
jgi:hypothetical protein